jgi:hypothetical protein
LSLVFLAQNYKMLVAAARSVDTGLAVEGDAVSVVQIVNIAIVNAFWPSFLGIISLLLAGMLHY